ncbi:chemotaxis protein CheW [Lachnospiraceae bacterium 29-91]
MGTSNKYMVFDTGGIRYAIPMEYVGYIVTTSEKFPHCVPPRMPPYVKRIMRMEQKLVPIIDLGRFGKNKDVKEQEHFYSLILVLDYQGQSVGVLTDRVYLLPEQAEVKAEEDAVAQRKVLNFGGENYILLDVPKFYKEIKGVNPI